MNKKFLIWIIIVVVIIVAGYFGFVHKYCQIVGTPKPGQVDNRFVVRGDQTYLCLTFSDMIIPFISGFFSKIGNNFRPEPSTTTYTTQTTLTVTPKNDTLNGWKNYNNGIFQLTLTDSWKGYKTEDQSISSNFGTGSVVFSVPTKSILDNGRNYYEMLVIYSYNSEYWKLVENTDGPRPVFLGRSGDRVFAYDRAQDVAPEDMKAFSDTPKILASFKLMQ